jgi:hypothetical protein
LNKGKKLEIGIGSGDLGTQGTDGIGTSLAVYKRLGAVQSKADLWKNVGMNMVNVKG